MDRHTVAKYWNGGGDKPADMRTGRKSGFDRYAQEIAGRARIPGVTAKGIHEWLLDRHADDRGMPGYNAFTHWLRTRGVAVGQACEQQAHPRFETPPGLQLQFDWKEDLRMHGRSGGAYDFNVYSSTLGFSRLHFFRRTPGRTRDDLLMCMIANIRWLGGVPRQWVTDNMSAVVTIGPDGRRRRSERVGRFAREAGFRLVLCRPRVPETKGKDESANRFLTRLLAYDGDFEGLEELDGIIARIQARCNEEANETTHLPPDLLFARREKEALMPLPNMESLEAIAGNVSWQVVPATMLVRAAGREFSVPRRCIGRRVRLVLQPGGTLSVFDDEVGGHEQDRHRIPQGLPRARAKAELESERERADGLQKMVDDLTKRIRRLVMGGPAGGQSGNASDGTPLDLDVQPDSTNARDYRLAQVVSESQAASRALSRSGQH